MKRFWFLFLLVWGLNAIAPHRTLPSLPTPQAKSLVRLPLLLKNGSQPQNLLLNPGFEAGFEHWTAARHPPGSGAEAAIVSDGCRQGMCLQMQHHDSTWQGTSQPVGKLVPGGIYQLQAWFKTSPLHYGYINLHDPDWKNAECEVSKRSFTVLLQGDGEWRFMQRRIRIPESDDCGESTADHAWRVYLYGHYPVTDNSPILYDDIALLQLTDFSPPTIAAELEEQDGWQAQCQRFADGMPLAPCPDDFVSADETSNLSGDFALVLRGARELQTAYALAIPVKPNATYRIEFSLKIADRAVYNYLNLDYPTAWTQQRPDVHDIVEGTKGIWSGKYGFQMDGVNLLPDIAKDAEYRSPSDVDWFHEKHYFQTGPDQAEAILRIWQQGFDGRLYLDGLIVEEVDSFIDDSYFHVPVGVSFKGMRIESVGKEPPEVRTNAARFAFTDDAIKITHEQGYASKIIFPAGFLHGLEITEEMGNVVLENPNILLSIAADSVLLAKIKAQSDEDGVGVEVRGPRPNYHDFEAGVIFVTDYESGLLFAPLRPRQQVASMPYEYDSAHVEFAYPEALFEAAGKKNWRVLAGFEESTWRVSYQFHGGEGFIAQPFPPKAFDRDAFCRQRMASVSANMIQNPSADFTYSLQKLRERVNVALLWMNKYARSPNDLDPPQFYCKNDAGLFVHCDDPAATRQYPVGYQFDVTGPYVVGEPEAMQRFVQAAHDLDMKVVIYMSPNYYYTSDVDAFLANLHALLEAYDLDGVYFDGVYGGDALRSLELVRKTRDLLGDRFYAQHISWERSLIRRSNRYRAPFLDDMADLIWNGEGVKRADDDAWRLNYCGRNVNNTPSWLLAELRPVDYSLSPDTSAALSLSPQEQIDKSLACEGGFITNPYGTTSRIYDKHFQRGISFSTDAFWTPYNAMCLGQTCGNGVCDVGETYETCLADCAPPAADATLTRKGDIFACEAESSVAQWLVDGEPFYALHFTFDQPYARDDSAHGMNPGQAVGADIRAPSPAQVDGRRVFAFDAASRLVGNTSQALELTGDEFSLFAALKITQTASAEQTIFALDAGGRIRFGLDEGKLFFEGEPVRTPATATIVGQGCLSGQCLFMQHNDATWQGVRQQVGQLLPGQVYTLTVSFKTTASHNGYINLYDRSWGRSCGGSGKSFTARASGSGQWQELSVQVTIPMLDDCGDSTADDDWWVYLYGHDPVGDNSPVYYDDAILLHDAGNLLDNPSFEEGMEPWLPASYAPPLR
ncbi:MAG: hypothetical protein GXP42_13510, partial [Chloroflexi bacterium]|nr:hypothetical protein [Chloroflexota bacterium]